MAVLFQAAEKKWRRRKSMPGIKMIPVKSSNVVEMGYDAEMQTLAVTFRGDRWYVYNFVPPEKWEELKKTDSVGAYLHDKIIGNYSCEKVEKGEVLKVEEEVDKKPRPNLFEL